jgi:hypothetical protein
MFAKQCTRRTPLRFGTDIQPREHMKIRLLRSLALIGLLLILGTAHAQCYIKDYQTGRKEQERDNNVVKLYSNGKRVAKFEAGYLRDYQTGRKLFEMDGGYVKLYSNGKRIAEIDGNYLKDYQTGKKMAEFDCPGYFSALAAAYYFF